MSEQDARGGEQTATLPRVPPPKVDRLPPFRVLLHNDDHNEALYVVGALREVAALEVERAVLVMMEADRTGVALVTVTHKERAELLVEQLQSKGLTATQEPAEQRHGQGYLANSARQ